MSAEEVAKAFIQHFYQGFDANVESLASLFAESSMLTFEGQQFQGSAQIVQKLRSFGQVSHTVGSTDVQPSTNPNAILVFVTGNIRIGDNNPLHFTELFQLVASGPGAYYVHNDIFRLIYG